MHNPHLKPHLPSQPVNLKSAWGKLLAFARPWHHRLGVGHGCLHFHPHGSG